MNQKRIEKDTPEFVEHFFRHQWSRAVSHLTRVLGTENIELAEDCVQEALVKAMQVWPYQGRPNNPEAWILVVARNRAYDQLRRGQIVERYARDQGPTPAEWPEIAQLDSEITDDVLRMIFACCHPAISRESQIILTLKILGGFGKSEIARALMKSDEAIAKAYTRAKQKLRTANPGFDVPVGEDLSRRLQVVLKILYLLYNEGYNSSRGESTINREFCLEAIRLGHMLTGHKSCDRPELHALLALMYFHMSRFNARLGESLEIRTLAEQNRSEWDHELINRGLRHLGISSAGLGLSNYHLEAGIAACHCLAKDFESTDWVTILSMYDILVSLESNPIKELNRVVAYSKVHGVKAAIRELTKIGDGSALKDYYLYYAIWGELMAELGDTQQAKKLFAKAIKLSTNNAEKKHLRKKLDVIS